MRQRRPLVILTLSIVLVVSTAPAVTAEPFLHPVETLLGPPATWAANWFVRLADWLERMAGGDALEATIALDGVEQPSPQPGPTDDHSSCVDPNGAPVPCDS
jgi:hypothetical protein